MRIQSFISVKMEKGFSGLTEKIGFSDSGVKVFEFFERYSKNVKFQSYNAAHSLVKKNLVKNVRRFGG